MRSLADLIEAERENILERWREQARRAASARGLEQPALNNILPSYLAALARGEAGIPQAERHFATRLRQGFQLAEIVDEFALLGRCIVERCLALPLDERPDPDELDELHVRVQRATAAVVEMFDAHMHQDEQIEKRYMRLLRGVATAAFHADSPALQSGLQDLLDLVMEAMAAQSAAILLRNPDGHLVTVATAGAQPLEDYAARLDPEHGGSFAAQIASSEHPATIWDVASTELEVPPGLRDSGIHALLGVQLASRSGLFGVIFVGVGEPRGFSSREVRRLETLAEQLVAHLDTVMILERLTVTIDELHKERTLREHFVSALAHDLRGPLAAAKLGAELLAQEPETLDARRDLAVRIDRNLDRLDRMIRDLLDVSLIRAGERLPLRLAPCDLGQLAQDVAEELRMLHGDRFVVDVAPGSASHVVGIWSAEELRRALWNLGTNAVKYATRDRPITFAVSRTGDRARVSVHNWGEPIAPEDQPHLFDPFARTRGAIDSGHAGWGLGLTLVRGCAEAHGGTASVASSATDGTTFTIELPVDARRYQPLPDPPEALDSVH